MAISEALKERLRRLAEKYENADFVIGDPSCILRRYTETADIETAAFIAALLAFGRRDQFLKKIDVIMECADQSGGPAAWISGGGYAEQFAALAPGGDLDKKFYRFYSYRDFLALFAVMQSILLEGGTLGGWFQAKFAQACAAAGTECIPLAPLVSESFSGCAIVPQGRNTANKRVNMFLRWMVRTDSPVDMGLWTWYRPAHLVIPLDTHVIQEAARFGLIPPKSAGSAKTAALLTEALREVWPDDPCKGDFALFGLGIDSGAER